MKNKIVVLSAMHGRHGVVSKMLENLPDCLDVVMVYSTEIDGYFIRNKVKHSIQFDNDPLWRKWDAGLKHLRDIDYDAVIILGSDDYVDENFVHYIDEHISDYDFIGFTDMYYSKDDELYYWGGYVGPRHGEPIGAGRVYSRELLERMDYNLFYGARKRRGLDGYGWKQLHKVEHIKLVSTLKENNLFCCDIKDEEGMTPMSSLELIRIK